MESEREIVVSDAFIGDCQNCGQNKRVCHYSDEDINYCDKCLVGIAIFRDEQYFKQRCPQKHWSEMFPEMVERLEKRDKKMSKGVD